MESPQRKLRPDPIITRSQSSAYVRCFDLKPLEKFSGIQLPTNSDVLRRYFSIRDEFKNRPKREIFGILFGELQQVWAKIPCPVMKKQSFTDKMIKLHDKWRDLTKNFDKLTEQTKNSFEDELKSLCNVAAKNAEHQIRTDRLRTDAQKSQDIEFLLDQGTTRVSRFGIKDSKYEKKCSIREKRAKQHGVPMQDIFVAEIPVPFDDDGEDDMNQIANKSTTHDNAGDDDCYKPTHWYYKKLLRNEEKEEEKIGEVYSTKKFIVNRQLLSTLDRTNTSDRKGTQIVSATAKAMGKDISKCTISTSTLRRVRKSMRNEMSSKIKNSFEPPKRIVVHFDGKILSDSSGNIGDRLAVIISGNTREYRQGKLLSAKIIADGTGQSQADEVVSTLTEWNLTDNVVGMCFDTTSSNTGWLSGAAVRIENQLQKPLLWLPCRKHIAELILKAAWESVFGRDMSPYFAEFKHFQDVWWKHLDKTKTSPLEHKKWMNIPIKEAIAECERALTGSFARDDYKECLELVLIVLGAKPSRTYHFKKPGAFHKARWMAPMIYGLKLFLFRVQMKKPAEDQKKLEKFSVFICLFYIRHWIKTNFASQAPLADLEFYKAMLQLKERPSMKNIAAAALDKLQNHTWYLNQEYVPLSFFCPNVNNEEKTEIAEKLVLVESPHSYSMGYPTPVELPKSKESGLQVRLSDSVGTGSLYMFERMGFSKDFIYQPVEDWVNLESFKKMKIFVDHLLVCNDPAERAIKLISDYAHSLTNSETDRQNLLQVVEWNRKMYPDQSKATLSISC